LDEIPKKFSYCTGVQRTKLDKSNDLKMKEEINIRKEKNGGTHE